MTIIIAKSMRLWVHIKGQWSLAHNQHAGFLWAAYISPYHKGKPYTCGELFLSDVHDHTELKCYWKSKQRNKKPTPHCWQSFIKTLHADTSRLHVANFFWGYKMSWYCCSVNDIKWNKDTVTRNKDEQKNSKRKASCKPVSANIPVQSLTRNR